MSTTSEIPPPDLTGEEYPYGPSEETTCFAVIFGLVYAGAAAWWFFTGEDRDWRVVGLALAFLLIGIYVALGQGHGRGSVILTDRGLYLPHHGHSGKHVFLPFSRISAIGLVGSDDEILQITAEDKRYEIIADWLPSPADFRKIMRTLQRRTHPHWAGTSR